MELEELKEEALKEYKAQRKALRTSWTTLVSKPGEWLYLASWCFMILAVAPPFFALLKLLDKPIAYLLPDGTRITSESAVTLISNGQVLQQVAEYTSRADISHALALAAVASVVLVLIGFILAIVDGIIIAENRKKFVEQYIFEHSKKA